MKTNNDPFSETTQLVLDRPSRADRDRNPADLDDRPRRGERRRYPARRNAPQRTTFEPLPLFSPASWHGTDFLTLGLGVVLIVGMFVAAALGISWVILPGAAALLFAMISTQLRWGRMSRRHRLRWHQARRAADRREEFPSTNTGGIVQLPDRKDRPRRAG